MPILIDEYVYLKKAKSVDGIMLAIKYLHPLDHHV